jgi:endonuclease/exonuclease/phosphatase family metal-dependent hydrolase
MHELLTACSDATQFLSSKSFVGSIPQLLKEESALREQAERIQRHLHNCAEVYAPTSPQISPSQSLKAVAWNIERGKNFDSITEVLKNHPQLSTADLFFLTEVDWGMARSDNRNVAAELGKHLGLYAYFAPSYYNFTKGHGFERHQEGQNSLGLHGKAILSRYPLKNLRVVSMPNATDKLKSVESRLGEKRALIGELQIGRNSLVLGCAHLDAFSSAQARAKQLQQVAEHCQNSSPVLIAGDWNTNTMNSTSGRTLLFSVLKQLIKGPRNVITQHHPFPERHFDKHLFDMLKSYGFNFENCNEMGMGTFDLVSNDQELGQMVKDQFPMWILKWVNQLLENSGGRVSLKLDWFAGKNLKGIEKEVIKLKSGKDFSHGRPSDHHPIFLSFEI